MGTTKTLTLYNNVTTVRKSQILIKSTLVCGWGGGGGGGGAGRGGEGEYILRNFLSHLVLDSQLLIS